MDVGETGVELDGLADAVGEVVGEAVGDGDSEAGELQLGRVITLVSRVTEPLRASTRPCTDAPVASVAEVRDITVPTKVVPVSRVVLLPTCQ